MEKCYIEETEELLSFIKGSPVKYQATEHLCKMLEKCGAVKVSEAHDFEFEYGKAYFLTRSMTSLIAFRAPKEPKGMMIVASHIDSPGFKLKPSFEKKSGDYITLDVEKYGGTINSAWLDRPLSVAGRISVREQNKIISKNVMIDRDLLVIPNVCIHFNRSINEGYKYNPQSDLSPLFAQGTSYSSLMKLLAAEAGVNENDIVSHDLYLYDRTPGCIWGSDNQFFSSGRIDNLSCAYSSFKAFAFAKPSECIQICVAFDNEETGSMSRQGAASTFLSDVINIICDKCNISASDFRKMLFSSFMLSADNAHALHPSHPEYHDPLNAPCLNGGVVIKFNAAQKYTTDSVSESLTKEICKRANVPTQSFANRSDVAGGSTLGNILTSTLPVLSADIGMPQLAMHSPYESAGVKDTKYIVDCLRQFFMTRIGCLCDGSYEIL